MISTSAISVTSIYSVHPRKFTFTQSITQFSTFVHFSAKGSLNFAKMIIYKDLFGGNDELASDTYKIKVKHLIFKNLNITERALVPQDIVKLYMYCF